MPPSEVSSEILGREMAFGLPPVITTVGGTPELLENRVSSFLVHAVDISAIESR